MTLSGRICFVAYQRILLKLSGEVLHGPKETGFHRETLTVFGREILEAQRIGAQVAVLIGGGNLFRGASLTEDGYVRATGDHIGMLATVINGLALQDALEALGGETRLVTSVRMDEVAEPYIRRRVIRHLEKGRIVLLVGGMGRPYFSTDTAAVQRALEIDAQVVLKGTRVDGVYDEDPEQHPDAKLYDAVSFNEAIVKDLRILDPTAFTLCRDNDLKVVVFNILRPGVLLAAIRGEKVGTLVNATGKR